jgi:hypothetical protein
MGLKTILIICSLYNPTMCTFFEDTREIGYTFNDCERRAYEILEQIENTIPFPYTAQFTCKPLQGT